MKRLQFFTALVLALSCAGVSPASDQINIVVGVDAPALEKFAAAEMAAQFEKLFAAKILLLNPAEIQPSSCNVLVGTPATNELIKNDHEAQWPALSDQGICIRSVVNREQPTVLVGGGSPVATMWAAYELGHHFGIRYMLHGDVFPLEKILPQFDGLNLVLEPSMRIRGWETLGPFACGPAAWTLEEHRRILGQLAKLKFNRVVLNVAPWQPFVNYEWKGVSRSSIKLWHGGPFRVDGDTAGRDVFQGAAEFTHPDFQQQQSFVETVKSGTALVGGVIAAAHERGMSTAIAFSPLEFPTEFGTLLPHAFPQGIESLVLGPGRGQSPNDPVLLALAREKIRAYQRAYPDVDRFYLKLPASAAWTGHHEQAWEMLRANSQLGDIKELRHWLATVTGETEQQLLQSGMTALACLKQVLADPDLFKRPDQTDIPVTIAGVDEAWYARLDRFNTNRTELLYGANRSAHELATDVLSLESVPAESAGNSSLMLTLHDRNLGPLPQCMLTDLQQLVHVLRDKEWNGYLVRYPLIGDSAPVLYYLSLASFDARTTPDQALEQFFTAVCGSGTVDAMKECYALLEQATDLIYENDAEIALPLPSMLMSHYVGAGTPPEWWSEAKTLYLDSLSEEGRAIERTERQGRPYLMFLIKRLVLGFSHFGTIEELRLSGDAKFKQDYETATEHFEAAIESHHSGLHALESQTRYRSDLGTIAILNAYGYHLMVKELDALYASLDEAEEAEE